MFKILLYYKYINIKDPNLLREQQYNLCNISKIKGRILISNEGINGTCAGDEGEINKYIEETEKILGEIEWKITFSDKQVFPKLKVVIRDEIVTLGLKKNTSDVSLEKKAEYIEPEELKELLENDENLYIIDARNDYETQIGKFKKTVDLPIKNFRDFPEVIKKIQDLKDKQIVTICTGGVRCEKASAYLRENGFTNVRQLHGGIVTYGEKTGGKDFQGSCYVFDQRIHVEVNTINPEIISHCEHCGVSINNYINCCNAHCNKQFMCCKACEVKFEQGCSVNCQSRSRYKVDKK